MHVGEGEGECVVLGCLPIWSPFLNYWGINSGIIMGGYVVVQYIEGRGHRHGRCTGGSLPLAARPRCTLVCIPWTTDGLMDGVDAGCMGPEVCGN